jgi:hypothetical protein
VYTADLAPYNAAQNVIDLTRGDVARQQRQAT